MGLLDWWKRRRGEVRAVTPEAQPGDERFRPDLARFERAADVLRPDVLEAGPLPSGGAAALPSEGTAVETVTHTTVTVNGREVDPADPRAAPLLALLRQVGSLGQGGVDPEALRRAVEDFTGGTGDRPETSTPPRPAVAERLAELEKLREGGLVTEAEYAEKRRRLLDEL
jgi:hypothetical protein